MKTKEQLKEEKEALLAKLAGSLLPQLKEQLAADLKESGLVEDDEEIDAKADAAAEKVMKGLNLGAHVSIEDDGIEIDTDGIEAAARKGMKEAFYDSSIFPGRRKGADLDSDQASKAHRFGQAPAIIERPKAFGDQAKFSWVRTLRAITTGDERHMAEPEEKAITSASEGQYFLHTEPGDDVIELLDNKTAMVQAVQQAGGMVLDVERGVNAISHPKESTRSTVEWNVGENSEPSGSTPAWGQVKPQPKEAVIHVEVPKTLVWRSQPSIERALEQRMMRDMGLGLDLAYLDGTGASGQPLGALRFSSISSYTLENDDGDGAVPTYDDIVDIETTVENNNGMATGFFGSTRTKGIIRKIKGSDGHPIFESASKGGPPMVGGEVLGVPAYWTNQIGNTDTKGGSSNASKILCGDFSQIMIVRFGGIELSVDPGTSGKAWRQRQIHVQIVAYVDIKGLNEAALCKVTGVIPN